MPLCASSRSGPLKADSMREPGKTKAAREGRLSSGSSLGFGRLLFGLLLVGAFAAALGGLRLLYFDDLGVHEKVVDGGGGLCALLEPVLDALFLEDDGLRLGARVVLPDDVDGLAPWVLGLVLDHDAEARLLLLADAGQSDD